MIKQRLKIFTAIFLSLFFVINLSKISNFIANKRWQKVFQAYKVRKQKTIEEKVKRFLSQQRYFSLSAITPHFKKSIPTNTPTKTPTPTKIKPSLTSKPSPSIKISTPTPKPTRPKNKPTNNLSESKLSIFMIGHLTEGAKEIIESNPPIIKVIDPQSDKAFFDALAAYKKRVVHGIVVVRFYQGTSGLYYDNQSNPVTSAEDFFNRVIAPGINSLGQYKNLFDYIQTPNEFENTPMWKGEKNLTWNGKFWRHLVELTSKMGMKICVGGIPVENIEPAELRFIINDLREMMRKGAAFCYHGYSFSYTQDIGQEIHLSLRYRQFYEFFRSQAPDLLSMPLILSEGGIAYDGNPYGGYLKYGGEEKYKDWLLWFDKELQKDPYVIGVTLFQIGNETDWAAFNLEPIADWLANHIRSEIP